MNIVQVKRSQRVCSSFRMKAKRGFNVALSVVIALSFSGLFSTVAYASESSAIAGWAESISNDQSTLSSQTYSYATSEGTVSDENSDYKPSKKYDLREKGAVTPVKFQNPWGTCWGFSMIAASETSLLSEWGETYDNTKLDLSELQLAKSVYNNSGAPAEYVGEAQAGEGYHNTSVDPNAGLNAGGFFSLGSSVFSAGIGPLYEENAPYKNSEGIIECYVSKDGENERCYLTEKQAEELEDAGATVFRYCWAGNYIKDGETTTTYTDWEVDKSMWNQSIVNLENGNVLPETRVFENGQWVGVDENAIKALKKEIEVNGRALSIAFHADQAQPGQEGIGKYINEKNWAHYTYDAVAANHAVTIVGWDDDYDRTNFGDGVNNLPEDNGAWLVKNSWGASSNEFPNKGTGWGDDGYFWLSYYDRSITGIESFDFDTNSYGDTTQYYIDQYDYLPEFTSVTNSSTNPLSSANIFTAEGDMSVRTLSTTTYKPNSTVDYQVYLLDDEATSPTDSQHSKLVYETSATYEYGGFHRTTLDQSDWIAMREGQRYAVVTTQYCYVGDEKQKVYYQGVAVNMASPTEDQVSAYKEQAEKSETASAYESIYSALVEIYTEMYGDEMSEEEIKELAKKEANTLMEEDFVKEYINNKVTSAVDSYQNAYFVSKVNAGESWTTDANWPVEEAQEQSEGTASNNEASASNDAEWTDWTAVKKLIEDKVVSQEGQHVVVDNAPIKAFSEIRDWASVDELSALEQAIKDAKAALESTKISIDGSDVDKNDTWMTQEQYDALKAAITDAEAQLALAGTNYRTELLNTTPSSEVVGNAISSLSFEAQYGTKGSADGADNADNAKSHSAKTGDNMFGVAQLLVLLIALSSAGGVASVAYRRRAGRE